MSISRTSHWNVVIRILQYLMYSDCGHNRIASQMQIRQVVQLIGGLLHVSVFLLEGILCRERV